MASTSPQDTEFASQENSPDSDSQEKRRGTLSSIYASTASSSSPEFTTDTAITPESDDDQPSSSTLKVEECLETPLDEIDEAKPVAIDGEALPAPRKRGRPRKHPVVDQKKSTHARSKTGCGTCSE